MATSYDRFAAGDVKLALRPRSERPQALTGMLVALPVSILLWAAIAAVAMYV